MVSSIQFGHHEPIIWIMTGLPAKRGSFNDQVLPLVSCNEKSTLSKPGLRNVIFVASGSLAFASGFAVQVLNAFTPDHWLPFKEPSGWNPALKSIAKEPSNVDKKRLSPLTLPVRKR
ncbi:hypothetical protein D3C87_1758990 [compost metagenome]